MRKQYSLQLGAVLIPTQVIGTAARKQLGWCARDNNRCTLSALRVQSVAPPDIAKHHAVHPGLENGGEQQTLFLKFTPTGHIRPLLEQRINKRQCSSHLARILFSSPGWLSSTEKVFGLGSRVASCLFSFRKVATAPTSDPGRQQCRR